MLLFFTVCVSHIHKKGNQFSSVRTGKTWGPASHHRILTRLNNSCVWYFRFLSIQLPSAKSHPPPLYAIFAEYITNPSRKHACVLPIPEFSAIRGPIMILCGLPPKFGSVVWNLAVWRDCRQEALFAPPTSPGGGDHIIKPRCTSFPRPSRIAPIT